MSQQLHGSAILSSSASCHNTATSYTEQCKESRWRFCCLRFCLLSSVAPNSPAMDWHQSSPWGLGTSVIQDSCCLFLRAIQTQDNDCGNYLYFNNL
uniref:Uncharacterized protein n=1 Tax=Pyxicephalus adspersus TaxID=30357 RepID=A0AAV3B4J6_PYXAD|nr:TPA: hypothetical protein GDO54_001635 [Pyxicephalus adspersus]